MIKPDGDASGGHKDGNSVTHNCGTRMIDLESSSANKLNNKGVKRLRRYQGVEKLLKMI